MRNPIAALATIVLLCAASATNADTDFRDPTRPWRASAPVSQAPQRFVVNAIIVSDDRRVAIINGKRVGEGQVVEDATVVEIRKNEIKLSTGGREITLQLRRGNGQQ